MWKIPIEMAASYKRKQMFGEEWFNAVPTDIFSRGMGFSSTWNSMTETNIAIFSTGITEFAEETIFFGQSERKRLHLGYITARITPYDDS
ncbi:MAG: hypothetical protein PVS3B3_23890 [Ktedonobacteraceae bacterium]